MSSYHIPRPTAKDIFRYRYQHGVNLGGLFVLEQWLTPHMFDPGVSGGSELDAVVSSLNVRGLEKTREKWEEHWKMAFSSAPPAKRSDDREGRNRRLSSGENENSNDRLEEAELDWLIRTAGCNHVRVPVGYFMLDPVANDFCRNTPFAMSPAEVYVNGWQMVKVLCAKCRDHGVGVLIDFQAIPGGANVDVRSGTSGGTAEL